MQATWNFDGIPATEPRRRPAPPQVQTESEPESEPSTPAAGAQTFFFDEAQHDHDQHQKQSTGPEPPRPQPRNDSRQCWLCLDEEYPTYVEPSVLDGVRRNRRLKKKWVPKDPSTGPLISPCLCKGSIKFIHESCLKEYIRNHGAYKCPTCGYKYQIQRLTWAARVQSPILTLLLTLSIFVLTTFLLGYIGDYILELYLDPLGTIADSVTSGSLSLEDEIDFNMDSESWALHFVKGLLSLGLLGFVKAFLAMSPWQLWNLRTSATVYGRTGATGRRRVENINLAFVVIGVFTFLWAVWKGTRSWINKRLRDASFNIMNVRGDEDDEDEVADAASDGSRKDQ